MGACDRPRIGFNDGSNGRGEVEKAAQGGSDGKTVPDCIYGLYRTVGKSL